MDTTGHMTETAVSFIFVPWLRLSYVEQVLPGFQQRSI